MSSDEPFLLQLTEADRDLLAAPGDPVGGPDPVLTQRMQAARTSLLELADVLGAHPFDLRRDPAAFLNQTSVAVLIRVGHLLDVPICALVDNGQRDVLGGESTPCPHRLPSPDLEAEKREDIEADDLVALLLAVLLPARAWIRQEDAAAILGWSVQRLEQATVELLRRLTDVPQIQLLQQDRCLLLRAPLPTLSVEQAQRLEEHLHGENGALEAATLGPLYEICRGRGSTSPHEAWWRWAPLVRLGWLEVDRYFVRLSVCEPIRFSLGLDDRPPEGTAAAPHET